MWMGWCGGSRERGGEGERAWNVAVGTVRPVYLMSDRQAGSVTPAESGLLSGELQREELISLLQWSSLCRDHQGENTEERGKYVIPDWTMWDEDRTILRSHELNGSLSMATWRRCGKGWCNSGVGVMETWQVVTVTTSSDSMRCSGTLMGPDPSRSGPRCYRQCFLQ